MAGWNMLWLLQAAKPETLYTVLEREWPWEVRHSNQKHIDTRDIGPAFYRLRRGTVVDYGDQPVRVSNWIEGPWVVTLDLAADGTQLLIPQHYNERPLPEMDMLLWNVPKLRKNGPTKHPNDGTVADLCPAASASGMADTTAHRIGLSGASPPGS